MLLNPERRTHDLIVIGGSAGGVEVALELLADLPPELPAAVALVIHRSPRRASRLVSVLQRQSSLPVREPGDQEAPLFVSAARSTPAWPSGTWRPS